MFIDQQFKRLATIAFTCNGFVDGYTQTLVASTSPNIPSTKIDPPATPASVFTGTVAIAITQDGRRYVITRNNSQAVVVLTIADMTNVSIFDENDRIFSTPHNIALKGDQFLLAIPYTHQLCEGSLDSFTIIDCTGCTQRPCSPGYKDGSATIAIFNFPSNIVYHPSGVYALVADEGNHCIRKISKGSSNTFLSGAEISTFAGSCADSSVSRIDRFKTPKGLAFSSDGRLLYVADSGNHQIKKIFVQEGRSVAIEILVGSGRKGFADGLYLNADFSIPSGIIMEPTDSFLVVSDKNNCAVRKIYLRESRVETIVGTPNNGGTCGYKDGYSEEALLATPTSIAIDPVGGSFVLVVDEQNNLVRHITLEAKSRLYSRTEEIIDENSEELSHAREGNARTEFALSYNGISRLTWVNERQLRRIGRNKRFCVDNTAYKLSADAEVLKSPIFSISTCENMCFEKDSMPNEDCVGFTYHRHTKTCFLHKSMDKKHKLEQPGSLSCHIYVDLSNIKDTYEFIIITSSVSRIFGSILKHWEKPMFIFLPIQK